MKKAKPFIAIFLSAVLTLGLGACQENPEGSIVAHKDMDKLISQAAQSDPEHTAQDVVSSARQTESYRTTLENESLQVKANVDAQVEVPQTDKLSVYRVKQKKFDQEFVDKVRAELMGDAPLYDGAALDVRIKSDIETEIQNLRQLIADEEANVRESYEGADDVTEEEIQEMIKENRQTFQDEIDALQEQYESAPSELDLSQHPSDGKLHLVKELYDQDPSSSFYEWLNGLSGEGDEALYGVTDGSDGRYRSLYVQNNADYSNVITYRWLPKEHPRQGGVLADSVNLKTVRETSKESFLFDVQDPNAFWQKAGVADPVLTNGFGIDEDMQFEPLFPPARISQEEAQATAERFLEKIGLRDFILEEGGLFSELINLKRETEKVPYGTYYIFHYYRQIDGVVLSQSSGGKFQESWEKSGSYNKQMWPGECIEFRINDDGIVGFDYLAPLEITETVVDGAALESFDQVKSTFEQMLPITLGSTEYSQTVDVDRVRLSYSRISEKDSFDTGLVVPVWSFEGTDSSYDEESLVWMQSGTLLAINAIDGSVIDGELGY